MISADTEKYYKLLSEKYPKLRILLTNALSDDKLKMELYEIATNIQNYDSEMTAKSDLTEKNSFT